MFITPPPQKKKQQSNFPGDAKKRHAVESGVWCTQRAPGVGVTGSDSVGDGGGGGAYKKDAPFCVEEESILRDDSPPNLQGLTFDMKSYCAGVLSPKFIHQLFTVDGGRISEGNYKGWVFSLRQKECDTANTPGLMWQS